MSRFNTRTARPSGLSPVTSTGQTATTYAGGDGRLRDEKSELFLLAVATFVSQDTFYESGGQRDDRFTQLVRQLAVADPEWTAGLLGWLRGEGNLRTASLVGAAEYVRARLDADNAVSQPAADTAARTNGVASKDGWNRAVIASVLQRPDEPGELLAYWTSRYGRGLPKPVKRGVADAVQRLYSGKALLKYDTGSKGYRFGDVLNLVHASPHPQRPGQGDLFRHALDRRHHADTAVAPASDRTLTANAALRALQPDERRELLRRPDAADRLAEAGFTWEALAGWLQGPMDREAWESIIPSMGLMALTRNLRNFDEAGVSDEVAATVAAKLADREQVLRSRQFPFRFLSAYQRAPSLRWAYPLEQALGHSLGNVPALTGRTLVLVDRSGSMRSPMSDGSRLNRADSAAVFGAAVAVRAAHCDLVQFGTGSRPVAYRRGESVLRILERFGNLGGTHTTEAIRQHYQGHDRVLIVTDEQAAASRHGEATSQIPANIPVYTWNLAGYRTGHGPSGSGNRHTLGGLGDAAFRLVPLLEAGRSANWPWLQAL
jgi:TROVE domain